MLSVMPNFLTSAVGAAASTSAANVSLVSGEI